MALLAAGRVSYTPSLDGPRLKIRRANEQIEALVVLRDAYRQEVAHQISRAELNPKTGKYAYRVHLGVPPPPEWGVAIGEIAHNLRSALDGLVYQLAALNLGKPPTRRSQFPIFMRRIGRTRSPNHGFVGDRNASGKVVFGRGSGLSMIADLRPVHQKAIEQLQPYKPGRGRKRCPLALLTEINNTDKHRLLLPVVVHSSGAAILGAYNDDMDLVAALRGQRPFRVLKDGAKLLELPGGMDMHRKLWVSVAFGNECAAVKGKGVINTLRAIAQEVSAVVEGFAPEFPPA